LVEEEEDLIIHEGEPSIQHEESATSVLMDRLRDRNSLKKPKRYANLVTAVIQQLGIEPVTLNMTVKQALRKFDKLARQAMQAEFKQLLGRKVWKVLTNKKEASKSKHTKVIPSSMFLKEKFDAKGLMQKIKARLVAGGHRVDKDLYTWHDTSSPTICLETMMMVLCIAASERRDIEAIDFPGAYLNAFLKEPQLMRLDKQLVMELLQVEPSYAKYVQSDGTILVELVKALYGLPEAAKLWYEHLSNVLKKIGYQCCPQDPCLFNLCRDGEKSTIILHVDDMLHTYTGNMLRNKLHKVLIKTYNELKIQQLGELPNESISYLGIDIRRDSTSTGLILSMPKYVEDLLENLEVKGQARTPAQANLFEVNKNSSSVDPIEFASKLMKIMYLAKRVRYDLLLPCTFLATRAKNPTQEDAEKLRRLLKYLNTTKDLFLTICPSELEIYAYVDASYA
jgi:hypothetical protein